jgi:glyoxylase-like metal-dependent hydrolase (beta-lactamase superfamily II)
MPRHQVAFGFAPTPLPRFATRLEDGGVVTLGEARLQVRHVPGHSPGHVIFRWDDEALVGDLIFAGSVGRTDLPGGNQGALARSIRERVYTLPGTTRLHPGHGPETTVEQERRTNPFVRPSAEA